MVGGKTSDAERAKHVLHPQAPSELGGAHIARSTFRAAVNTLNSTQLLLELHPPFNRDSLRLGDPAVIMPVVHTDIYWIRKYVYFLAAA